MEVADIVQRTYGEGLLLGELLDVVETYAGNFWSVQWMRSEESQSFLKSVGVEYNPKLNIDTISEDYLRKVLDR